jgi:hypothetical protein
MEGPCEQQTMQLSNTEPTCSVVEKRLHCRLKMSTLGSKRKHKDGNPPSSHTPPQLCKRYNTFNRKSAQANLPCYKMCVIYIYCSNRYCYWLKHGVIYATVLTTL